MTKPSARFSPLERPAGTMLTRRVQLFADLAVTTGAFGFAYLLRFDFAPSAETVRVALIQLPMVVLIQVLALSAAGVYTYLWRYIGIAELRGFGRAAAWSFVPLLVLRLGLPKEFRDWRVPLSVLTIDTLLAFAGCLGARVLPRILVERAERRRRAFGADRKRRSILLVGAGRAGVAVAREIEARPDLGLEVRGFLDDDPATASMVAHGVPVLGTTLDLPRLARELAIDHVVLTVASASRADLRRVLDLCDSVPIKARIIPAMHELVGGSIELSRIRDIRIEDLLGREPITLDEDALREFVARKTVLVTGAGGSIGAELARQVARFAPARVVLVERAEGALFDVDRRLRSIHPQLTIDAVVADVTDARHLEQLFERLRPQLVLHAAAHKHVPLMEMNACEAVQNNVFGTLTVAELATRYQSEAFVLISTDKAVRPHSVMGATKRVAELFMQELDHREAGATRFQAVRFGNVIGSAGSVVPLFREQILSGGPVRVTHPEMVRYFMTIPEAAQLVLQAAALGKSGEIFVLDMGEPVRIVDLACEMIRLHGLRPHLDIEIAFTGIRPGEKLFEELIRKGDSLGLTTHPKIRTARLERMPPEQLKPRLERLRDRADAGDERGVRECLSALLPEATLHP